MTHTELSAKIKDFLAFMDIEKNCSKHTLRAYSIDLNQLLAFWKDAEKKQPAALHAGFSQIIRRYVIALFYKKMSKTSLARKLSSLRSLQQFLQEQGIKGAQNIRSPKLDKKLPVTLSIDEIFYLLDAISIENLPTRFPYRDKAIFELIYATGVRCSELVSIKLTDISYDEKIIKIMGKGKKERIVLFGSKAQEMLELYITKERPEMLKNKDDLTLFVNYAGGPLTTRSVQRIFEMFRSLLKVDRSLTPHKIRHSFATHLLQQGVDLRMIQELLGHKTIATTEIYTHITNKELSKMCDEKHPLNNLDHLVLDKS